MSDSLWLHGLQCSRLPCPSPTPRACTNSCPLSQRRHPTISSSVVPFSSCLPSFPTSGSFPMSQFFASGGQSIGTSASASTLPVNIQYWFPLGLTGLGFLESPVGRESTCNARDLGSIPGLGKSLRLEGKGLLSASTKTLRPQLQTWAIFYFKGDSYRVLAFKTYPFTSLY